MPSLAGMKGEGYYDHHSSVQRATLEAVRGWIEQAADGLALPAEPAAINLADYGCSEGSNSIAAVGLGVEALRRRRADQAICAVHIDLPTNNFNQLFANIVEGQAENYYQVRGVRRPDVFALAAGGSFYERILPPGSVHLGWSFLALQWLDRLPEVAVPEFVGYMGGTPVAQEAFACQARNDLARFLECRAHEMGVGSRLLIVVPGRDGQRLCSDGIYDALNDACLDMVAAGRVERARYERFVFPVYFRSVDELVAPVQRAGSSLSSAFRVERAEVLEVATPFVEAYRATGDLEVYAEQFTSFLRATSEPLFATGLVGPRADPALLESLYQGLRARVVADPRRYAFHNIEVSVLLARI